MNDNIFEEYFGPLGGKPSPPKPKADVPLPIIRSRMLSLGEGAGSTRYVRADDVAACLEQLAPEVNRRLIALLRK